MRALAEQTERFGSHWKERRINRTYVLIGLVLVAPLVVWFAQDKMPTAPVPAPKAADRTPKPDTVMSVTVVVPEKTRP
jgi:hypothetical protein